MFLLSGHHEVQRLNRVRSDFIIWVFRRNSTQRHRDSNFWPPPTMVSHSWVCSGAYYYFSARFSCILMGNYAVFFFMCSYSEIFLLVPSGLVSSLMSSPFLVLTSYKISVISCTVLFINILFDLVTLVISLADSSFRISLKLHVLRALSPGYVIFIPISDVM